MSIFQLHSGEATKLTTEDFENLAKLTKGYSGSDISIICNESLLKPVRILNYTTHFKKVGIDS